MPSKEDILRGGEITEGMRLKARAIAQDRIANARYRARLKSTRMTPKKAMRMARRQEATAKRKAEARLRWQRAQDRGQGTPLTDLPNTQVGGSDPYYVERIPENKARFTPQHGLMDIPLDLKEGVKAQLVEKFAVPPGAAADVASNAIDKWLDIITPQLPADAPTQNIPNKFRPDFLIHQFSDVKYTDGDSLASTFSGLGEETMPMPITNAPDPAAVGGNLDAGTVPIPLVESHPTTREPANEVVAVPAPVTPAAKDKGSMIPLAIGAGVVIFMLLKK